MHAVYPWNVTLTSLSSSSYSLLVLCLNASFTPHAWTPRNLGFSLLITGVLSRIHLSWPSSAVWVTDARCHIALTLLPRTHQHILVIDAWPLFGTLAHVPCETLTHAARGTQLMWPTITSNQRRTRIGRYKTITNESDHAYEVQCSCIGPDFGHQHQTSTSEIDIRHRHQITTSEIDTCGSGQLGGLVVIVGHISGPPKIVCVLKPRYKKDLICRKVHACGVYSTFGSSTSKYC